MSGATINREHVNYSQRCLIRTLCSIIKMFELQRFELCSFLSRDFQRNLRILFELHEFQLDRVDCQHHYCFLLGEGFPRFVCGSGVLVCWSGEQTHDEGAVCSNTTLFITKISSMTKQTEDYNVLINFPKYDPKDLRLAPAILESSLLSRFILGKHCTGPRGGIKNRGKSPQLFSEGADKVSLDILYVL